MDTLIRELDAVLASLGQRGELPDAAAFVRASTALNPATRAAMEAADSFTPQQRLRLARCTAAAWRCPPAADHSPCMGLTLLSY